jgi:hypothetical protein
MHLASVGITPSEGTIFPMIDSSGRALIDKADHVFPFVATAGSLPIAVGVLFVLGLIASTYSASGSALTALTTSFTIDILRGRERLNEERLTAVRQRVSLGMALLSTLLIILFDRISNSSAIDTFYSVASYSYGPLLGMFAFGIISKRKVRDRYIPIVAILSPIVTWVLDHYSKSWFGGYEFSFELLIVNALFTAIGLYILSLNNGIKDEKQ